MHSNFSSSNSQHDLVILFPFRLQTVLFFLKSLEHTLSGFFKQSHNRVLHEYILVCYTTGNPDIITTNTFNSACQCKDLDKFACSQGELLFVHKWWMYTQGEEQRHRERQSQTLSPIISTVILFHLWQGLKDNPGFLFHQPTNMSQNSCHGVCTWKLNKSKIMQLSSYTVSKTIPLATIHIKNMDTLKP